MLKINIEICHGTTCYILGSSTLAELKSRLPEELVERVELIESPCMKACDNKNFGSAPFVRVGGRIIADASTERIVEAVYDELRKETVQ